jgi:tetratricopeptide (TPR) repeat protein
MKTCNANSTRIFIVLTIILITAILSKPSAQNNVLPIIVKDQNIQKTIEPYEKGDYSKVKSLLEEIIVKNNKNADAHHALAIVNCSMNNLDDAITEEKKALELNSNNAEYHYILARLYIFEISNANIFRKISLSSSSEEELLAALKIDPNHNGAMIALGNFYYQAPSIAGGDIDKAIEQANNLIKIDEKEGRLLLVQIYYSTQNYEKATEESNKLIKVDEYLGRYMLIQIYKKQGNTKKAEAEYDLIDNKFGNNPEHYAFYNDYGYYLLGQKRVDKAIEKFKKLVELAPKSANAHDSLGEGYLVKGMLKESLAEYSKALELDPNLKNSKDKIEEIKNRMKN